MPTEPITIWTNARFTDASKQQFVTATANYRVFFGPQPTSNLDPGIVDPRLAESDIAFGQPDVGQCIESHRLKWIHLSTAGYTRYDRDDLRAALKSRGAILTNSSSVYAEPTAQHALAFMLALSRNLLLSDANQRTDCAWPQHPTRRKCYLLTGQSALLLGFGTLASRLAELLAPFHMDLCALRRSPRGSEPIPVHAMDKLDDLLPRFDHVIDTLPGSPETNKIMNDARFAKMKPGSRFFNIGRGTTVDQPALIRALASNHLAAAYLDVTDPEPLPPNDPLWKAPNCHITPHTAGGFDDELGGLTRHFLGNLKLREAGEALRDKVF